MPDLPALLIVDAANVVGSVPDGWWHDRVAATTRLRDALAPVAASGPAGGDPAGPVQVVLVVEGSAREIDPTPEVGVIAAPGTGDDAIIALLQESAERDCVVVTADRGLRERVRQAGARVLGPRAVPRR